MEVFNSDHGSNILSCGNLCTAGSQIFKTKEFTWFSEVNYFECIKDKHTGKLFILTKPNNTHQQHILYCTFQ